ncbi:hypothetical protein GCM10010336_10540 [Streptomyces goshikiensis]|nr:hypothetical protein GCM10010336_10540 [Streptomyces goshikiensis]
MLAGARRRMDMPALGWVSLAVRARGTGPPMSSGHLVDRRSHSSIPPTPAGTPPRGAPGGPSGARSPAPAWPDPPPHSPAGQARVPDGSPPSTRKWFTKSRTQGEVV